ncbi:MAG: PolC-type DNA polymerase III [Brachymonas sp.]
MVFFDWLKPSPPAQGIHRWVVLDVETSGLEPQEAQLLAVAAIAVQVDWPAKQLRICPGDSLETDIQPAQVVSDKSNILIHGIGQQRQQRGMALREALPQVVKFIADSPLLAFHAWFDKIMISRHLAIAGHAPLPNPWIDIEKLCIALYPKSRAESLDDWMDEFDITCAARHEAAADTFAECEVLQRLWPQLALDARNWKELKAIEQVGRRLR